MFLDAERFRCDSMQVPLQIAEHLNTSLQPVHTPVLLDRDGCPTQLKAREYVQLVWSEFIEVVEGGFFVIVFGREDLLPFLPVAEDHPPPLLDTYS